MRDRRGQFSGQRIAVDMSQFRNAVTSLELGKLAPPPLVKQHTDQTGLQEHHRTYDRDQPAILFPSAKFAKIDSAAGRQQLFADAPSLQLPPVEFGCGILRWLRSDVA